MAREVDVTMSCMVYASATIRVRVEEPGEDEDWESMAQDKALDMIQAGKVEWEVDTSQTDDDYELLDLEEIEEDEDEDEEEELDSELDQ